MKQTGHIGVHLATMDAFVDAFIAINESGNGKITFDELHEYVKRNNLDGTMETKWRELFDPKFTGTITLETFCDTLGLKMADVISKREALVHAQQLPSDVHVITSDMSIEWQILLSNEARRLSTTGGKTVVLADLTKRLKLFADEKLGPDWQVGIVDGSYWFTYSHLPGYSFQFNMNGHSYLFWKIYK